MQILDGTKVIGLRADGSPIFWIAGGSGGSGDGSGGDDGAGSGGSGDDKGNSGGSGNQIKDDKGTNKDEPVLGPDGQPWDPKRAMNTIEALREENKGFKTKLEEFTATQAKRDEAFAEALGLKPTKLTPEKMQEQLAGRDTRIQSLESENGKLKLQMEINKKAFSKNADSDLLWALLQTTGGLEKLDLSADDFGEKIDLLLDDVLSRHPQLKRTGNGAGDAGARGKGDAPGSMNEMIRRTAGRR